MGGEQGTGPTFYDLWSFDGTSWTQHPNVPWVQEKYTASVSIFDDGTGAKVYLSGGYDNNLINIQNFNEVWAFDGTTWSQRPNAPWVSGMMGQSYVLSGKLYYAGGQDYQGNLSHNIWSTTNGSNWVLSSSSPVWSPRAYHATTVAPCNIGSSSTSTISQKSPAKVFLMGGIDPNSVYDETVFSSSNGSTWNQLTNNAAWGQRQGHASVYFLNKIWVLGGNDGITGNKNDVWSSPDGINWTQVTSNAAWSPRSYHTALVYNNKIWVIGGGDNSMMNDVWSSPDGVSWTQATANAAWYPREYHTSVVFNNKMWVIGGKLQGFIGPTPPGDVWWSSDGITWTPATTNAPWSPRASHSSTVFNNKMWIIGGYSYSSSSTLNDVWSSPDGINWTQVTANANWFPRYRHTSVTFLNKMWVFGGCYNNIWSSLDGITWSLENSNLANFGTCSHSIAVVPITFGLPDITVMSLTFDPNDLHQSFTNPFIHFDFTIKNISQVPVTIPITTHFTLYKYPPLSLSSILLADITPSAPITLQPNQTQTFTNMSTTGVPNLRATLGPISIYFEADATNVIAESNETNNIIPNQIVNIIP